MFVLNKSEFVGKNSALQENSVVRKFRTVRLKGSLSLHEGRLSSGNATLQSGKGTLHSGKRTLHSGKGIFITGNCKICLKHKLKQNFFA
jgi:hypothetical protein